MEWQFVVALVIAIPVILLPVALIWYVNIGGVIQAFRGAKVGEKKEARVEIEA